MSHSRKPRGKAKTSIFENQKGTDKKLEQAKKRDVGKIPVKIDNRTTVLKKIV